MPSHSIHPSAWKRYSRKFGAYRESRLLVVGLVPTHHVDRAMRVPYDRFGDASYKHPLYRAEPPAAHHDRPHVKHSGKPDELLVRSARPEVRLGHLAAF